MIIIVALLVLLVITSYVCCYSILHRIAWPTAVLPFQRIRDMIVKRQRQQLLRALFLIPRNEAVILEKGELLRSCGLAIDALVYEAVRRTVSWLSWLLLIAVYIAWKQHVNIGIHPGWLLLLFAVILTITYTDHLVLRVIRRNRRNRIIADIQGIALQMQYYRQSRMNLHHKLQRCVPLSRYIRRELQLLLNEWYDGAAEALHRFKIRLGTDEAADFTETLNALRLSENEHYYDLLAERLESYKEKLAIARDEKKEAMSYVLFLLAGIPILATFRVFIYPWVAEAEKLFGFLGS